MPPLPSRLRGVVSDRADGGRVERRELAGNRADCGRVGAQVGDGCAANGGAVPAHGPQGFG